KISGKMQCQAGEEVILSTWTKQGRTRNGSSLFFCYRGAVGKSLPRGSKQRQLAGLRHPGEGSQRLQLLNMGLGQLVAAHGELLNGDELLPIPLLHCVDGRRLSQAVDRCEGRQQTVLRHFELGGIGLINVDRVEVEAPQVELIAHLQGGQQVLLHRRGVLVVLDLPDLPLHRILSGTAVLRIKGLGPDGEKGCI
ncbi:DUF1836 domain-containing protein, partial [Dysosmobacter welbionis]